MTPLPDAPLGSLWRLRDPVPLAAASPSGLRRLEGGTLVVVVRWDGSSTVEVLDAWGRHVTLYVASLFMSSPVRLG